MPWVDGPDGPMFVPDDQAAWGMGPDQGTSYAQDGAPPMAPPAPPQTAPVPSPGIVDPLGDVSLPDPGFVDPGFDAAGPDAGAPAPEDPGLEVFDPGATHADMAGLAPGDGAGSGFAVATRGVPEAKQKGITGRTAAAIAAERARGDADKTASARALMATTDAVNDTIISTEDAAAAPSVFAVERARADANSELLAATARAYADFARTEEAAHRAGAAMAAKARADFQRQVAAFAAMKVDPGQWYGNLTPGQRAGSLASVFVAGFLGSKGVNTTVMASLNDAVDRNIDAQLQNIANAGKTASMFQQAWDMVRAESATDAEARGRIRALSIVQLGKEIDAELSRYDAPMAQATRASARAESERMMNEHLVTKVFPLIDERTQAAVGSIIQEANSQRDAAIQYASIAANERMNKARIQAEKDARAAAGVKPEPASPVFIDPRDGKAKGKYFGWVSDTQKADLQERAADYASVVDYVGQAMDLMRKHGAVWGPDWGSKVLNNEDARTIKNLLTKAAYYTAYARSGKATGQKEMEQFKNLYQEDTWFTNGDTFKQLSTQILGLDKEMEYVIKGFVQEPGPGDQAYLDSQRGLGYSVAGAQGKLAHLTVTDAIKGPEPTVTSDAVKEARGGGRGGGLSQQPAEFVTEQEAAAWDSVSDVDHRPEPALRGSGYDPYPDVAGPVPPAWFVELHRAAGTVAGDPAQEAEFRAAVDDLIKNPPPGIGKTDLILLEQRLLDEVERVRSTLEPGQGVIREDEPVRVP